MYSEGDCVVYIFTVWAIPYSNGHRFFNIFCTGFSLDNNMLRIGINLSLLFSFDNPLYILFKHLEAVWATYIVNKHTCVYFYIFTTANVLYCLGYTWCHNLKLYNYMLINAMHNSCIEQHRHGMYIYQSANENRLWLLAPICWWHYKRATNSPTQSCDHVSVKDGSQAMLYSAVIWKDVI